MPAIDTEALVEIRSLRWGLLLKIAGRLTDGTTKLRGIPEG
jgi:hypothetical protein